LHLNTKTLTPIIFVEISGKKCTQKKLFAKNFYKLEVYEEEVKLKFCTLVLPITFLAANFSHFS
jgi:hypothetical protein